MRGQRTTVEQPTQHVDIHALFVVSLSHFGGRSLHIRLLTIKFHLQSSFIY